MSSVVTSPDRDTNDGALRVIVAYKAIKGALQILLGIGLFVMVLAGHTDALQGLAEILRHNASQAWALRAASYLMKIATPRHVELTALALVLDGALGGVESWALHTRRWWAEWLVVIASGSLLPYEVFEIVRHLRVGRVVVLVVNAVIVVYLAHRAWRRGRKKGE